MPQCYNITPFVQIKSCRPDSAALPPCNHANALTAIERQEVGEVLAAVEERRTLHFQPHSLGPQQNRQQRWRASTQREA